MSESSIQWEPKAMTVGDNSHFQHGSLEKNKIGSDNISFFYLSARRSLPVKQRCKLRFASVAIQFWEVSAAELDPFLAGSDQRLASPDVTSGKLFDRKISPSFVTYLLR